MMKTLKTPAQLKLPYPDWRPQQWETIEAIAESTKNYFIVDAPSGFGKSGLAIGLLQHLGESGLILCKTKQLQDQYKQSFPGLITILKGKGNYECPKIPSLTAAEAICALGFDCNERPRCPYWIQKREAIKSPITVLNYTLFLLEANYAANPFHGRQWIILDECHVAETELMKLVANYISFKSLRKPWPFDPAVKREAQSRLLMAPFDSKNPMDWVVWAERVIPLFLEHITRLRTDVQTHPTVPKLMGIAEATEFFRRLQRLTWGLDPTWLVQQTRNGVRFRPVWVDRYARDFYFKHARKFVLMSATPPRPKDLGLDTNDVESFQIPSVFPKERRPIYYWPVTKLGKNRPIPDKYFEAVDQILDKYRYQKGLVHSVNFMLRDLIMERSRHKHRFITHGPQPVPSRELALETYKATSEPAVLLSPSMNLGVDLPYDLCLEGTALIKTEDGPKPISELKIGDNVLTHKGRLRTIKKCFQREYKGPMEVITIERGACFRITPEHEVYAWSEKYFPSYRGHPILRQASRLQKGDWLYRAIMKNRAELIKIGDRSSEIWEGTIFNIHVADDESYVIDKGPAVKNCSFQIIAKLPFPDLGDIQIAKRFTEDQDWFTWMTVMTLVQSYGRIMRAPDDAGDTYIIDSNFKWLAKQNKDLFPTWFREAVIEVDGI